MLTLIIIFVIGLLIGSFLNVVIYRMNDLHTVLATRSHCPHCKKEIKWYDLIPFVSFIILKTKCRSCGKPISWQYPLVELGTALIFMTLYLQFGNHFYTYFLMLISCFLIVIFVYDLLFSLIPDEMLWPAVIISAIYIAFTGGANILMSVYGVITTVGFLGIIYLLGKGKWMGLGDVKLAILLGLVTPFPSVFITLFFAFVIGSIYGLIMIAYKQKTFKSEVPFGPFLIVGLYISLFWGQKIIDWYLGII
jgi:leader peptidase (prepilin peptidase)/N-methyltransferase